MSNFSRLYSWITDRATQAVLAITIIPGLGDRVTQQDPCIGAAAKCTNGINVFLSKFFDDNTGIVMKAFFAIISGLALILLIWSGIQYITAQGNQDATKKARQRIINIVMGIVLLVAAYAIINLLIGGISNLANRVS